MDDEEWWPPEAFAQDRRDRLLRHSGAGGIRRRRLDLFTSGLVLQAFARWNSALALSWVAHENLCLYNIYRNANEEQRRRYLPGLCNGTLIGALGSDRAGRRLRRDGLDADHRDARRRRLLC
jgi:isovaleryl-CoA dehydrogenase